MTCIFFFVEINNNSYFDLTMQITARMNSRALTTMIAMTGKNKTE